MQLEKISPVNENIFEEAQQNFIIYLNKIHKSIEELTKEKDYHIESSFYKNIMIIFK